MDGGPDNGANGIAGTSKRKTFLRELNRGSEIKDVKWKAKHSIREVRLKRDEAMTVCVWSELSH